MLGYTCAYYRYHYPLEFIAAYLNNASNEEDIVNGTTLARQKGIKILPPKFRYSRAKYFINKETNSIYKGVSSIKYLNEDCAEEMYKLRDKQYDTFTDLLIDLAGIKINSRQIEILIKLNFFSEFGRNSKLLKVFEVFNEYSDKKQIKKDLLLELPFNEEVIKQNSKETAKLYKIDNMIPVIKEYEASIENKNISIKEQIEAEIEFYGYPVSRYKCDETLAICIGINEKYSPKLTLYYLKSGETQIIKCYKKNLYSYSGDRYINEGTIINIIDIDWKPKKRKIGDDWIELEEIEPILTRYQIV